jgi:hypothetical protein
LKSKGWLLANVTVPSEALLAPARPSAFACAVVM